MAGSRTARPWRAWGVTRLVAVSAMVAVAGGACGGPAPSGTAPAASGAFASNGTVSPSLPPTGSGDDGATPGPSGPMDDATLAYGYGAAPNPAITYEPDVVFVGGGPSIIRDVSATGLVWTIDANAPGAADLAVGKVMYATSRAVGRVAEIHDAGGTRVVTLLPITLTDLVRDAHLEFSQPLDLGAMAYQAFPDLPGALTEPAPSASGAVFTLPGGTTDASTTGSPGDVVLARQRVLTVPPLRFTAATDPAAGHLPPPTKGCPEVGVGNWSIKPCIQPGVLSLAIGTKAFTGLRLTSTISIRTSTLMATVNLAIAGGLVSDSTMVLTGIDGVDITLAGGVADPSKDNTSVRIEVPIEGYVPLPPLFGIPLSAFASFRLMVETAFSGKSSTLKAKGAYKLTGPIGIDHGKLEGPSLEVTSSLLDSLQGINLGPEGIVVAAKFKFQFGVGGPGVVVGPYISFIASVGMARGSTLGSPLATCRGVTLDLFVGGGAGLQFDGARILPFLPPSVRRIKIETEALKNVNVFHGVSTQPAGAVCNG